jgi:peptide/nickel transport system substrate-binding protein
VGVTGLFVIAAATLSLPAAPVPWAAAAAAGTANTSTLVLQPAVQPVITDNFNPFDTTTPLGALGAPSFIYEPLLEYNELQVDQYYPWLARSWSFNTTGLTLTFDLRAGVKWDDGAPFTAADVAYTFNLLKNNPALDDGIPIVSAVATNPTTFTLTLSQPGYAYLFNIARVPIVKAGFAQGTSPLRYVVKVPDGTGPYVLARPTDVSPAQVVLTARKGYWQPGAPSVGRLVFPAYRSTAAASQALAAGKLDWAGDFMPDVKSVFEQKDASDNHFWAPTVSSVVLQANLGRYPLDQLAVRRAVSLAVGRQALSAAASGGYAPPASTSTGLVLPLDSQYLSGHQAHDLSATGQVAAARRVMTRAGFVKDSRGFWATPAGRAVAFTMAAPSGTMYASVVRTLQAQLRSAGFDATAVTLSPPAWASALTSGRLDSAVVAGTPGPSPYYMYASWVTAPLAGPAGAGGKQAAEARADLARYMHSPSDSGPARTAIEALAGYVSREVPVVPLLYGVAWAEFSTRHASGWPDGSNPYEPASPTAPFDEYTVLQLTPGS